MGTITESKRQLAWVFDLNKCIGCQTCSVACRVLWNDGEEGADQMWWMTVNTKPGRGTPRDWETMGGGFDPSGKRLYVSSQRGSDGRGITYEVRGPFDSMRRRSLARSRS